MISPTHNVKISPPHPKCKRSFLTYQFLAYFRKIYFRIGILSSVLLTACSSSYDQQERTVFKPPVTLKKTQYNGTYFSLAAWQRLSDANKPIHIYIEGDGAAWRRNNKPPLDPTPNNPIALKLASIDPSENVIYLARPCQFITPTTAEPSTLCSDNRYWTSKRFAKEVVHDYLKILDQITQVTSIKELHLIGFSGGANIAGLIAARRHDVKSIRTVAGNVDNDFFVTMHRVTPMPLSLNVADEASKISHIPQRHFIGEDDRIVPIDVFNSYATKIPYTPCIKHMIINNASHNERWDRQWNALLQHPVNCSKN